MAEELRVAFERWARGIGFTNFEVKDEDADDLEREYCDDDVELVWCAFVEGEDIGWKRHLEEKNG
jgi:hypothetical protein